MDQTTNVHKLQDLLENEPTKGQVCTYFACIGKDGCFVGPLRQFFNKWGGGAFGLGLDGKVKQAYEFLCHAYKANDEIYLFGFSRGAYTALSVAGMIRKCGLIDNPTTEPMNEFFALCRKKGARNAPDKPHIMAERKRFSPRFATSQKDAACCRVVTLSRSPIWAFSIRWAHVVCPRQSLVPWLQLGTTIINFTIWRCLVLSKVRVTRW